MHTDADLAQSFMDSQLALLTTLITVFSFFLHKGIWSPNIPEDDEALARIRNRLAELCRPGDEALSLALGAATTAHPVQLVATLRSADERMYEDKSARSCRA